MSEFRTFVFGAEGQEPGKLVHDGIVESNVAFGAVVDYVEVRGDRLLEAKKAKLEEEQAELAETTTDDERRREQGDVNDVLHALGILGIADFVPNHTFDKGHFVMKIALPQDTEEGRFWVEYYSSHPDRFTEITE